MTKKIIFIFMLLPSVISISAQKEVYFNIAKPEGIKVESMQGIETRLSFLPGSYTVKLFSFPEDFNGSFYIGYFHEKRIANSWTLNTTIGLQNIALKTLNWRVVTDSINGTYIGGFASKIAYYLILEAGIEPRWYFSYKDRYQLGKSQLNSGWYLSFPFLIQANLLHTPEPVLNIGWFPNSLYGSLTLTPTLGFRQAISKNWFLESSVGLGANSIFNTYNQNHQFYLMIPFLNPTFSIKAAYTFK